MQQSREGEYQVCAACGEGPRELPDGTVTTLLKCGKCHITCYHDKDCQRKHWKEHKKSACGELHMLNKGTKAALSDSFGADMSPTSYPDIRQGGMMATNDPSLMAAQKLALQSIAVLPERQDPPYWPDPSTSPTRVRGSIGPATHGNPSQATLDALNQMTGAARFYIDPEHMVTKDGVTVPSLSVEFVNATHCGMWCDMMNTLVFRDQCGALVGEPTDSAVESVGPNKFRFPMEFTHLMTYINEGVVFYDTQTGKWEHSFPKPSGNFEVGFGYEAFSSWMQRQFSRLAEGVFHLNPVQWKAFDLISETD